MIIKARMMWVRHYAQLESVVDRSASLGDGKRRPTDKSGTMKAPKAPVKASSAAGGLYLHGLKIWMSLMWSFCLSKGQEQDAGPYPPYWSRSKGTMTQETMNNMKEKSARMR